MNKLIIAIIVIILQVLIAIIPLSNKKLNDNRSRFPKGVTWLGWITLICAILAVVGSITVLVMSENQESKTTQLLIEKLDSTKNENMRLQAEVIKNQKTQNDTLDQIKKLSLGLIDAQRENYRLQKELYNNVTGNRNFPTLVITGQKSRALKGMYSEDIIEFYLIEFHLINTGKYPLNSIRIDFTDHYGFYVGQFVTITKNSTSQAPDPRFDPLHPASEQTISLGTLPPSTINRSFYITYIPMFSRANYAVKVSWVGGAIEYDINLKNINKKSLPITYSQVYTTSDIGLSKKSLLNGIKDYFPDENITVKSVINRYGK